MTGVPMDETYFNWLYEKVRPKEMPELVQYTKACAIAHRIIFNWTVPNDDNRAAEGKELRYEFMQEFGVDPPPDKEWMGLDSSIFEMMVALARRCNFIVELGFHGWFDIFMGNLELEHYNDSLYMESDRWRISRMLTRLNERRYKPNGKGGLFPLKHPKKDQREVELWYQMAAYMAENKMY
jgi:hypothetical protein